MEFDERARLMPDAHRFDPDVLGVRDEDSGTLRVADMTLLSKLPYGTWYHEVLQEHFRRLPRDAFELGSDSRAPPLTRDTLFDVPLADALSIVVNATDSFMDDGTRAHKRAVSSDRFFMYLNAGLRRALDEGSTPAVAPRITITLSPKKIHMLGERLF